MKNHIENIKIKNIFYTKDINWDLKQVNVLVGKNGLGKTTILNLIKSALTQEPCKYLDICDEVTINLYNNKKYYATKDYLPDEMVNALIKEISTSDKMVNAIVENIIQDHNKLNLDSNMTREIEKNIKEEIKNKIISELTPKRGKKEKSGYKFTSKVEPINTVFISTSDMNISATNNVITSSGSHIKFLNIEILREIESLIENDEKYPKHQIVNKLLLSLNSFFIESNKKALLSKNEMKILLDDNSVLEFEDLSSGERQILFILLKVANSSFKESIILMDEPEISLHLSWQEKLLDEITRLNKSSQIVVVTHSPAMVMNGWFDCLTDIKDIFVENDASSGVV